MPTESAGDAQRDSRLEHVMELLTSAEAALSVGDAAHLGEAAAHAQSAISILQNYKDSDQPGLPRLLSIAWRTHGSALRDLRSSAAMPKALRAYETAMAIGRTLPVDVDPVFANDLALTCTAAGIAHLIINTKESIAEAIRCLDEAVHVRARLDVTQNPALCFSVTTTLVNRADAFGRLGTTESLAEAARTYDEAIRLLRMLDPKSGKVVEHRLASSLIYRGVALLANGCEASVTSALESFDEVVLLLHESAATGELDARIKTGTALANRSSGMLLLPQPDFKAANECAVRAVEAISGLETGDAGAAWTAFKAYDLQCKTFSRMIADAGNDVTRIRHIATRATDTVDDALQLARAWEAKKNSSFRHMATQFFKFGAHLYLVNQPHFLGEFLLENLDPERTAGAFAGDKTMHTIATDVVGRALEPYRKTRIVTADIPDTDRNVELMRDLESAAVRLSELRPA